MARRLASARGQWIEARQPHEHSVQIGQGQLRPGAASLALRALRLLQLEIDPLEPHVVADTEGHQAPIALLRVLQLTEARVRSRLDEQ